MKKIWLAVAITATALFSAGCPGGGYQCYWQQTCYDQWGYAYECGYYYECY